MLLSSYSSQESKTSIQPMLCSINQNICVYSWEHLVLYHYCTHFFNISHIHSLLAKINGSCLEVVEAKHCQSHNSTLCHMPSWWEDMAQRTTKWTGEWHHMARQMSPCSLWCSTVQPKAITWPIACMYWPIWSNTFVWHVWGKAMIAHHFVAFLFRD